MNLSQMNCTMETSYQNKNIRMFGILTQNQKFNRFIVYTVISQLIQLINQILIQNYCINLINYNSTSPKKYLRTNFIKKGWSLDNNEIQIPESIDQKTRNFSQNTSNSIIFSNQTVRERTQNQSFSQKNNLNGQYSTNQTPYNQKKISSVDINQSFNQFATSTQSVSPKRQFKKPKINQNLNQSFYKQLFPSQRSKNRAFIIMKNILLNESKGIHNYTYSNMLFNQKYRSIITIFI